MKSYRPKYHASVLSGWSNDPNGTIFYQGKAHLFFQHYPYKPEWGTMHWGHFVTEDFVKWEEQPLALVPDQEYEVVCGCCSGSAIEKDGDLWLMYTAAQPERQRQCIAVSTDGGVHFVKRVDNPILTAGMLSPEVTETDCRDPRLFRKDGYYYFLAGARVRTGEELAAVREEAGKAGISPEEYLLEKTLEAVRTRIETEEVRSPSAPPLSGSEPEEKDGFGNLILARSKDLLNWEYVGHLLDQDTEGQIPLPEDFFRLNGVYECPDYISMDGKEIILTSPQNLPQMGDAYQNVHSGLYLLGQLDFETGRFRVDYVGELDSGFDFYAAQTLRTPDGRVILLAWKEMWDRNFPTQKEGWAGTYSLPRELHIVDGSLIQQPVREIENYRQNPIRFDSFAVNDTSVSVDGVSGNAIELQVTMEADTAAQAGVKLFCGSQHETLLYFDRKDGKIVFDRSRSGIPFSGHEDNVDRRACPISESGSIDLRIFLDISSIEVFINGGRYVMTGNAYPDLEEDMGVQFFAKGGSCVFRKLAKYDIVV